MASTKTPKSITIIARYEHKNEDTGALTGIVSYLVRSSNGKDQYCTTLIEGNSSACRCTGNATYHRTCQHMKQTQALEVVRAEKAAEAVRHNAEVASQFAAQVVPSWFVELVDAGTIVAPTKVETTTQEVASKVVEIAESLDIPVAEVEAIAEIAAEHKREMTEGKHTDFELPVRPGRKPRKYATEMMQAQQHYASVKSQMAEIRERREAEARGNLNGTREFALMR